MSAPVHQRHNDHAIRALGGHVPFSPGSDLHRSVAQALANAEALGETRANAAAAEQDPRLVLIADELRARAWTPEAFYSCGCGPDQLCPPHRAMRDVEVAR